MEGELREELVSLTTLRSAEFKTKLLSLLCSGPDLQSLSWFLGSLRPT
ncbi:MAG: hypothetical protein RL518_2371 [Pseudomonadota bacterium]|jgi:hypothetical protein